MDLFHLHEKVRRGTQAKLLMENPAFTDVANELFGLWGTQMFTTAPEDDTARRVIHAQHLALQHIVGLLTDRIRQGDDALEQLNNDDEEIA
jgi:hypothetical protein